MASSVKSRNTQLQSTIDAIFLEISTISPHIVTLDCVKKLAEALEKNQCFDTGHPKGGTRLDIFEDIKKKMTMHRESRATLITWLVNFAGSYSTQFERREQIEGIQLLMGPRMNEIGEPDKSKATEWLKKMCLKPVFDEGIPGLSSLSKSILVSCKYENVDIGIVLEEDLEKRLVTGMNRLLQSKNFDKCIPQALHNNDSELKKMKKIYLGLPLCVLHASENLKVNIRIHCFPSEEEVNFYNQKLKKTRNVTIHLGLIGQETYVPIVKITEDDPGKVMGLKETIERLRETIQKLEETETKTEKEKQDLKEKITMYKKLLEEKKAEYRLMRQRMSENARIKIQEAVNDVARQVTQKYADQYDKQLEEEMNL